MHNTRAHAKSRAGWHIRIHTWQFRVGSNWFHTELMPLERNAHIMRLFRRVHVCVCPRGVILVFARSAGRRALRAPTMYVYDAAGNWSSFSIRSFNFTPTFGARGRRGFIRQVRRGGLASRESFVYLLWILTPRSAAFWGDFRGPGVFIYRV